MDIFVINLDRDQERWASLQSHAQEQGLTLIRHSAVYGKALTEAELKSYCGLQEAQLIEDLPLTPGEIGCYLSHIAVMKRIVDQDLPYACVLEDDVSFLLNSDGIPLTLGDN